MLPCRNQNCASAPHPPLCTRRPPAAFHGRRATYWATAAATVVTAIDVPRTKGDSPCTPYWVPLPAVVADAPDFFLADVVCLGPPGTKVIVVGGVGGSLRRAIAAIWDGARWSDVPGLDALGFEYLSCVAVHDDGAGTAVYFGGKLPGQRVGVARWDGAAVKFLPGVIGNPAILPPPFIETMVSWGGSLYVGGAFERLDNRFRIGGLLRWDGVRWTSPGELLRTVAYPQPVVGALAPFDAGLGEELFVGGTFTHVDPAPSLNLARWNGSALAALDSELSHGPMIPTVSDLLSVGPAGVRRLYATGRFGSRLFAAWDTDNWEFPSTAEWQNAHPYAYTTALVFFDDGRGPATFVGGVFQAPENPSAFQNIARWDGARWQRLGEGVVADGLDGGVFALSTGADALGSFLVAVGRFDRSGTRPLANAALWRCVRGDLNCDGQLNVFDVDPFVLALTNADAYAKAFPYCPPLVGDMDGSGVLDHSDVEIFVAALVRRDVHATRGRSDGAPRGP